MTTVTQPAAAARTSAPALALLLLSMAQFLIALDYSVVYVALPSIGEDLQMSPSGLHWVVSAYAVLFAGFLLLGGRLGDRYGHRRSFVVAMLIFGVASLAGGLATHPMLLLIARGAQGIGAALLQPAIIALINTTFEAGPARSKALSVWGTIGASGLAAGAILGGILTTASWRWTMLVNLPIALVCVVAAFSALRPDTPVVGSRRLSIIGAMLATAASLATVTGLTLAGTDGWTDPLTAALLLAGLALILAFVIHERRSAVPLIEPSLRKDRRLRLGSAATALYMASVGAEFFVVTLVLQQHHGLTPLLAGLGFLPLAGCIVVGNMLAGRLIERTGQIPLLALAFAVDAIGLGWLALTAAGDSYTVDLLPGLVISGIGHGMTYTAMFVTGTSTVPDAEQGTAGAVLTTSQYMSAAASLAILVLVMDRFAAPLTFQMAFLATALFAVLGAAVAGVAWLRWGGVQPDVQ